MKFLRPIGIALALAFAPKSSAAQTVLAPFAPPTVTARAAGVKLTIENGRLLARPEAKQSVIWRFGQDIQTIAVDQQQVFALSTLSRLSALNLTDGRSQWSVITGLKSQTAGALKLTKADSVILASAATQLGPSTPVIVAIRVTDGQVLWRRADPCGSNGPAVVAAGLVVWDFTCTGAVTRTELRAFSLRSGKLLWERRALNYGAVAKGFLHILALTADGAVAKVERLELASGRGTTRTYTLTARPSCGQLDSVVDQRLESGALVFSGQDGCGVLEVRIPLK
jgi:PQQ-like domain